MHLVRESVLLSQSSMRGQRCCELRRAPTQKQNRVFRRKRREHFDYGSSDCSYYNWTRGSPTFISPRK